MKTVSKIAALALMLGMTAPAMAAMNNTLRTDPSATDTNPMVNKMDTIKGDMAPHANAPGSIAPKAPDAAHMPRPHPMMHDKMMRDQTNLTPAEREAIAQKRAMHHDKMKAMTPAQREAARKDWQMKRAEWAKMTPAERAAAKAKWEADHAAQ